jgi:hypothetical protein
MPQIHYIKPTFSGGELAPSMYSRVDVAKYGTGAKTLRNVIVHPYGGASNTPGTHYVGSGKTNGLYVRLHDFVFSQTQAYAIEFGNQYIRFYSRQGRIMVDGDTMVTTASDTMVTADGFGMSLAPTVVYEISSPYLTADLAVLNFTQSADTLFIFHPSYQTRLLQRVADNSWTLSTYTFTNGPFRIENSDTTLKMTCSVTTGSGTLTASSATFYTTHVGSLWKLIHNVAEQSTSPAISSSTTSSSISCGGTWRLITHGTWAGVLTVQKSTDAGSTWTNVRTFSSASDFNANTFGTEDMSDNADPFLVRVNMTTYTSGTCNVTLTADAYVAIGVVQATAYTSSTVLSVTVKRVVGATSATPAWAEGSWSDYRGWPAVGEFNQDRLVTGNNNSEPQTSWMTKTSNYYDYSISSPVVDSDSISVNLPTRQLNGINGFVSLSALIALTSSSEWAIGTPNTPITPSSITQRPNGYTGSSGLKPVVIKNRAVFVQAMGGLLADLGYDLYSDSFTGSDLSILANHLFTGYTITDMAYQQYPDSLVWCVRSDGKLLSMTYLREQEVLAWTWHDLGGLVESICVIPYNGYNQLWLSVNRDGVRHIEYMDHRLSSFVPQDQFFVFAGLIYQGDPATVISGLDHLEGKSVAVNADGNVVANYLRPFTVVSGQITLPFAASKVIVGLTYYSDIETLNIEVGLPDGTLQGRKSKVTKSVIRVVNSRGGYMGPDSTTLQEIKNNFRTTYDTSLALYTGDLKHTLSGGYNDGGRMLIRQYDPMPLTVSAIIPIVSTAGMTSE